MEDFYIMISLHFSFINCLKKILAKLEHLFYTWFMRIACVYIPHFYVQVERILHPESNGLPIVIGGLPEERAAVVDCSEEMAMRGVSPSMPLKDAYHLCPHALFMPFNQGMYEDTWEKVIFTLQSFTPRIETGVPGLAYLDITRTLKIYKDESLLASAIIRALSLASQLKTKVGIGNSRFVARVASSLALRDTFVVQPGEEKILVSPLSIETLPIDEAMQERLHLLGLHTLKKVANISRTALISQFGSAGKPVWEIANGMEDGDRILPAPIVPYPEREVWGEMPLETIEQLEPLLGKAIDEIVLELKKIGKLCRKIRLTLYLLNRRRIDRYFFLQTPVACPEEIWRRIVGGLESLVMESAVTGFKLYALALSPRERTQDNLFRAHSFRTTQLKETKDYLKAKYGSTPMVKVREEDGNARLPERKFIFVEA